jgi:hypothetical protein
LCLLLGALCVAGLGLSSPATMRADPFEAALGSLSSALPPENKVGDFYWLENDGLATKLVPAPLAAGKGLTLLASDVRPNRAAAALWRLDQRGQSALVQQLRATLQAQIDFSATTANNVQISGKQSEFTLTNGTRGLLTSFTLGANQYAIVLSAPGGVGDSLPDRRDEIVAGIHAVVLPEEELVAPLLLEGQFAGRLIGYSRKGKRYEQRATRGWISVSLFSVSGEDYANRDALQFELEQQLKAQGLRRTGGDTPNNPWGVEAYCGQYFTQGHISRILYAKLGADYFVALFHGSESSRELLEQESMRFGASLRPTGLAQKAPPPRRNLSQAGNMEIMAWQEGGSLCWGALFERPWREDGIKYEARLTSNGRVIVDAAGDAASSVDFNPVAPGSLRRLNLPPDAKGDVQFELRVGTSSASMRVTLR